MKFGIDIEEGWLPPRVADSLSALYDEAALFQKGDVRCNFAIFRIGEMRQRGARDAAISADVVKELSPE